MLSEKKQAHLSLNVNVTFFFKYIILQYFILYLAELRRMALFMPAYIRFLSRPPAVCTWILNRHNAGSML